MLALTLEARAAATGIVRLVRGDPAWEQGFDFTPGGFVRSFIGPILALPLYVAAVALVEHAPSNAALWQASLAHVLDAFGFPLLLAIISGPMRFKAGYTAFVIVNNWAALYLNVALLAASLLALLGPSGEQAFSLCSLLLLCLSVLITWRIARETLSRELAPVVLVVVLSLAWGAFADVGAGRLLS
ncbi:hypothetical protein [Caulobacter sp. S45]|uniref:hypothetical protein n=1 Tax=Caulobacter sp. S45 TaxID=1641861 RepID=UPI0015756C2D|nr:hypothetical protein [Caulobacter sp. S45]